MRTSPAATIGLISLRNSIGPGWDRKCCPVAALLVETLIGLGQQPATPIQRIVFPSPVAHGLVLHSAVALVELGVGEFRHVERIRDLGGVGQHRVEHLAVGAGGVEFFV
jgi:hypothetical protein